MSVRIQNDGLAGAGASEVSRPSDLSGSSTAAGKLGPVAASPDGDQVELSSLSGGVAGSVASANARQADRVRHLAELYASGRYQVDAAKVSRAMISDALGPGLQAGGEA